jgi:hypothetical protein
VNKALVMWYSKQQNTVEISTFGSEFVAMQIGTEMIEALLTSYECLEYRLMDLLMHFVTMDLW